MTSSSIALIVFSLLVWIIVSVFITLPMLVLFYLFIKRARVYCKAKQELKRVLQERDSVLTEISNKQ